MRLPTSCNCNNQPEALLSFFLFCSSSFFSVMVLRSLIYGSWLWLCSALTCEHWIADQLQLPQNTRRKRLAQRQLFRPHPYLSLSLELIRFFASWSNTYLVWSIGNSSGNQIEKIYNHSHWSSAFQFAQSGDSCKPIINHMSDSCAGFQVVCYFFFFIIVSFKLGDFYFPVRVHPSVPGRRASHHPTLTRLPVPIYVQLFLSPSYSSIVPSIFKKSSIDGIAASLLGTCSPGKASQASHSRVWRSHIPHVPRISIISSQERAEVTEA